MKKFLFGVGNVVAFQGDNIVFVGKTMIDTAIEISTSSTPVRAGFGNALYAEYYHTSEMTANITEAQWSLPLLALTTGASILSGGVKLYESEASVLSGVGTIPTLDPIPVAADSVKYVYRDIDGDAAQYPMTGDRTFDATGIADGKVCVSYLYSEANAERIEIPSNIVPNRVKLMITANLFGSDTGEGAIGTGTIEIPVFQLDGTGAINMTADGVSNTPVKGKAIAYDSGTIGGCANSSIYAKITEHVFDSHWYDRVIAIAIEGGDLTLSAGDTTTLRVYAVTDNDRSFLCDNAQLTFESSAASVTAGAHTGLVTGVSVGTAVVTAKITDKTTIENYCTVTVE